MKRRGRCEGCRYGPLGSNRPEFDPAAAQLQNTVVLGWFPIRLSKKPCNSTSKRLEIRCRCTLFQAVMYVRVCPFSASCFFRGMGKCSARIFGQSRVVARYKSGARTFTSELSTPSRHPITHLHLTSLIHLSFIRCCSRGQIFSPFFNQKPKLKITARIRKVWTFKGLNFDA